MACARTNPIFLPKSLFDSYIVKSDGGEVTADRIQTLKGAEKKVSELARKYPCVGFSITSAKHGGVIKHYAASTGRSGPKVDKDNSREYKQEATKEAKESIRFRLYVDGNEYADYETKAEAEKVGRKEGGGGKWRVKQVSQNPNYELMTPDRHGHKSLGVNTRSLIEARKKAISIANELHVDVVIFNSDSGTVVSGSYVRPRQNPVEIFTTRVEAHRFAARTIGATVIPAQSGGYVVVYPVGGRGRNPSIAHHWQGSGDFQKLVGSNNQVIAEIYQYKANGVPRGVIAQLLTGSERDSEVFPFETARGLPRDYRTQAREWIESKLDAYRLNEGSIGHPLLRNPMTGVPSHDIPLELHHGRSQRQAVAMALSEQRRLNPAGDVALAVEMLRKQRTHGEPRLIDLSGAKARLARDYPSSNISKYDWRRAINGLKADDKWYDKMMRTRNPSPPQTDYDFKMQVKALASGHERYTSLKITENKVRALYKAFRKYQLSKGSPLSSYPNWASSQKMPSWIAEPFYESYIKTTRNPSTSEADAADMFETFHGEPSGETLEYHVEEFERTNWAVLGDLIQLKVETTTGKLVELNAPDPERSTIERVVKLVASPDGKQLAFIGGDQAIDIKSIGFTDKDERDLMLIGLVCEFTYRTQKAFDAFETTDYYHEAGEETPVRKVFDDFRRKPSLLYCPHDETMKLAGGLYEVKDVGVVN